MLRIGNQQMSKRLAGGITITSATALYTYSNSNPESLQGLRRQSQFWSRILPIAASYYYKTSPSSPYVQYLRPKHTLSTPEAKASYLTALHEHHAPAVLQTILSLRGLYIKLGQVLSVTALPIPEPYREVFRTLQSDVPGFEKFESAVRPTVEAELGRPLGEVYEWFEEVPCGAASIGQAHRARLRGEGGEGVGEEVVVKVQYPDAVWQVPADIRCVGDFLKFCVWAGVVDGVAATLSYEEFARQFLAELDYAAEKRNLEEVYRSSLEDDAPYRKHGVVLPEVFGDYCSGRVITMGYLPGPKFEAEAKRQLALLGIDTTKGIGDVVRNAAKEASAITDASPDDTPQSDTDDGPEAAAAAAAADEATLQRRATKTSLATVTAHSHSVSSPSSSSSPSPSLKLQASELIGRVLGVDLILWFVRLYRQIVLWQTISAVSAIQALSSTSNYLNSSSSSTSSTPPPSSSSSSSSKPVSSWSFVPKRWEEWAEAHQSAVKQSKRLQLTESWIHALFDVHGHQIFQLGLFNADPHPGNILVIDDDEEENNHNPQQTPTSTNTKSKHPHAQLGLIDYGQCKRLPPASRLAVANLLLSVANNKSDAEIASAFRSLGIRTQNDSTEFLAEFARLMFGRLRPEHLRHSWHAELHGLDRILYFPNELSMVYRTSLLLRGLGMSLQVNCAVGEEWREHAQALVDRQKG